MSAVAEPQRYLEAQIRRRPAEIAFWLATLLPFVLTPNYLVLASQIAITALFALSLDLILGYAGIVSLGHAAYFGFASYTAGLIAKLIYRVPEVMMTVRGTAYHIIPEVLTSGDHRKVDAWRRAEAERLTRERRPDLWAAYRADQESDKKAPSKE